MHMLSIMHTPPIMLPGVAGPLVVRLPFWTKITVYVNGAPITFARRGRILLPGVDGRPVEARLLFDISEQAPRIKLGDITYRLGPATPLAAKLLGMLPLFFVFAFGIIGGGLWGAAGLLSNRAITRTDWQPAAKTASMLGVIVLTGLLALITSASIALLLNWFAGERGMS